MPFSEITNLRITSVVGAGDIANERVVIRATRASNLVNYLLLDATDNNNGTFATKNSHVYWFPEQLVSPYDFVVLYTKFGFDRSYINNQGFTVHVFYWGLSETVWNEDGDGPVLINTGRIAFRRA